MLCAGCFCFGHQLINDGWMLVIIFPMQPPWKPIFDEFAVLLDCCCVFDDRGLAACWVGYHENFAWLRCALKLHVDRFNCCDCRREMGTF
jgi:hypothetical protein